MNKFTVSVGALCVVAIVGWIAIVHLVFDIASKELKHEPPKQTNEVHLAEYEPRELKEADKSFDYWVYRSLTNLTTLQLGTTTGKWLRLDWQNATMPTNATLETNLRPSVTNVDGLWIITFEP